MAGEIVKQQVNRGQRREIYHFRDEQGLEVGFLVPGKNGAVSMIECKATRTPVPSMAASLVKLRDAFQEKQKVKRGVKCVLVHRKGARASPETIVPGVKAMDLAEWMEAR